jgi:uncharacterized membrane protein YebE (DUF533 family)
MFKNKLTIIWFCIGAALIIGIGAISYAAYNNLMKENIKLRNEITQFKTITETLARSSNQWTTKSDLKNELSQLLKPSDLKVLRDDIKKQGAKLSAV